VKIGLVLGISFISNVILSQAIFGVNGYIEYIPGELPIVISVPHGGDIEPSTIPDRTCNDPVYATDMNTIELSRQIDSALFELTGCHPHIIICHLDRKKLDCNRSLLSAACNNLEAETAWNEFHGFILQAQSEVHSQNTEGFYIDLHGHGNTEQRIELGYMLYEEELELPDQTLNSSTYINYSSLYELVYNNISSSTHAELLRGENALGTLLGSSGFPAVPSAQIPFPGIGSNYFSGGYNTNTHTSANPSNTFSGVQVECNYTGVRDNFVNRKNFSTAFSQSVIDFMSLHYENGIGTCSPLSMDEGHLSNNAGFIFPNPISVSEKTLHISGMESGKFEVRTLQGQMVQSGSFEQSSVKLASVIKGMYFILLSSQERSIRVPLVISE
jgi:hypothetical protein